MINIIAAVADNGAIGKDNALLWHIREDLKYFKQVTLGCPVIMGRRTFESLGRPLPGRLNIVVSRSLPETSRTEGLAAGDVCTVSSLEKAVALASGSIAGFPEGRPEEPGGRCKGPDVFIIGGGEIYRQAIPLADRLYVTEVHTVVEDADTFFPALDDGGWKEVSRSGIHTDPVSGLGFEFVVYDRGTD